MGSTEEMRENPALLDELDGRTLLGEDGTIVIAGKRTRTVELILIAAPLVSDLIARKGIYHQMVRMEIHERAGQGVVLPPIAMDEGMQAEQAQLRLVDGIFIRYSLGIHTDQLGQKGAGIAGLIRNERFPL